MNNRAVKTIAKACATAAVVSLLIFSPRAFSQDKGKPAPEPIKSGLSFQPSSKKEKVKGSRTYNLGDTVRLASFAGPGATLKVFSKKNVKVKGMMVISYKDAPGYLTGRLTAPGKQPVPISITFARPVARKGHSDYTYSFSEKAATPAPVRTYSKGGFWRSPLPPSKFDLGLSGSYKGLSKDGEARVGAGFRARMLTPSNQMGLNLEVALSANPVKSAAGRTYAVSFIVPFVFGNETIAVGVGPMVDVSYSKVNLWDAYFGLSGDVTGYLGKGFFLTGFYHSGFQTSGRVDEVGIMLRYTVKVAGTGF